MSPLPNLKIKLFADGADGKGMLEMARNPMIRGFTTNPTLMRKAGISDFEAFARQILQEIPDRPISFEVIADDFEEMERQAYRIADWGANVYVKIPITNTRGESCEELMRKLAQKAIKINATALLTLEQVSLASQALKNCPSAFISVLAGRIADTGRDPVPVMAEAVAMVSSYPQIEIIWGSPRELWNVFQADAVGCQIITATNDILKKLEMVGKNLTELSLETVKMFREDALKAGYRL